MADWLCRHLAGSVEEMIVCDPRQNKWIAAGAKNDRLDAAKLAAPARGGYLKAVYHGLDPDLTELRRWVALYHQAVRQAVRTLNQVRAGCRMEGLRPRRRVLREESGAGGVAGHPHVAVAGGAAGDPGHRLRRGGDPGDPGTEGTAAAESAAPGGGVVAGVAGGRADPSGDAAGLPGDAVAFSREGGLVAVLWVGTRTAHQWNGPSGISSARDVAGGPGRQPSAERRVDGCGGQRDRAGTQSLRRPLRKESGERHRPGERPADGGPTTGVGDVGDVEVRPGLRSGRPSAAVTPADHRGFSGAAVPWVALNARAGSSRP